MFWVITHANGHKGSVFLRYQVAFFTDDIGLESLVTKMTKPKHSIEVQISSQVFLLFIVQLGSASRENIDPLMLFSDLAALSQLNELDCTVQSILGDIITSHSHYVRFNWSI